ncbi:MAG TPA: aminotransferase class V-fold PLP-dependent enzyme [Candidatus Polarisedimenticolaceae bacterium]|nr:aminotransferase class V-fold PLP-dependent enzyme [Candidatus Polarisedimenticolaceae bacterium]
MSTHARLWQLDPAIDYLNHGSFGACPRAVLDYQQRLRERLEHEPCRFLARDLDDLLARARAELAAFLGAAADDLAFVTNATSGVNTVLRSLELQAGEELLLTDHAYHACRNAAVYVAARAGARVVTARVPFPLESEAQVLEAVLGAAGPRTRLALLDHVASPTGLIFPIERLVAELQARGVDVLVDGAHAPGMVPLQLERLGAAYYTGNCHKWLCAPKGAAFLHVRRDRQAGLHPLVISHGYDAPETAGSRFRREFDWVGTCDPTAWLAVPHALRLLGGVLPGGWPALMERNRALALRARTIVGQALDVPASCPEVMVGSLAALPLPPAAPGSPASRLDHNGLMDLFHARFNIETWLYPWPCPGGKVIRLAAQLYNDESQFHRLAAAVREVTLRASI